MNLAEKKALFAQLTTIKKYAEEFLEQTEHHKNGCIEYRPETSTYHKSSQQLKKLSQESHALLNQFENLTGIRITPFPYEDSTIGLRKLIIEVNGRSAALQSEISEIPEEQKNRLDSLKNELEKMSGEIVEANIIKNLEYSIEECEQGHDLASWLISGRVVRYMFEKIPPHKFEKNESMVDKKVEFLKKENIIPHDRRDTSQFILKAEKETRNVSSHDIRVFAGSKESISLLADTLKLVEYIWIPFEKWVNKNNK